jgi:hypothetical protein
MPASKNKIRLPTMTPGTARSIAWLRFGRAGARPKVYLQAAIHANELPGGDGASPPDADAGGGRAGGAGAGRGHRRADCQPHRTVATGRQ